MSPVLPQGFGARNDSDLRLIGLAVHNLHDTIKGLPTRSSIRPDQAEQSWITHILPFAGLTSDIDLQKPWDDADNRAEIRKLVPLMLNPGLRPLVLRDANGYGVSHYAGNTHLFDHPGRLSLSDIGDGTANTLLIGEVCADFQPWAKPRVNRDPALGINRSPKGFGGPAPNGGTRFLMADGSVRFFSNDVDPAVLRALGTPNGREPINGP